MIAYDTLADGSDGSDRPPTIVQPSSLPKFAGSLDLFLREGVEPIIRRLLSLPGGIHSRKLILMWFCEEEISLTAALVERCSHTLEFFKITCNLPGTYVRSTSTPSPITSVTSRVGAGFDRLLEGDETQGCGLWGPIREGRLDHRGTPNDHTRTSRSSANFHLPSLQPNPDRCWCQHQANSRRANFWAVVGV